MKYLQVLEMSMDLVPELHITETCLSFCEALYCLVCMFDLNLDLSCEGSLNYIKNFIRVTWK